MVTAEILPFRENSHGWARNRTRDLMINSQRLWPLDHEAGHSYTLLHDVNEFLPILPTFLDQFKWNSVKEIST